MRSDPGATCEPMARGRSRPRTWTRSWRPGVAPRRPATSRRGTLLSAPTGEQLAQLAGVGLGVPEDRFCAVLITLGVPADRPLTPIERPDRRPLNEVVHRGHW